MGAYIGADEKFGSGDEDTNQRKFERVTGDSFALELAYREIATLKDKLAQQKLYLEDEIRGEMDFEGIVGQSAALRHVLNLVETVASSDSTVLLLGETGTGKELIARAIHERSRRKSATFPPRSSRNYCGLYRNASLKGWVATERSKSMCGW